LCSNAVVLVKEIKEPALWFFERRIGARLEISQIRKDTLLELFRILHRSPKRLKSEGKTSHNVGTGDVEEIVPAIC
jgi:hypothetical protein